MTVLRITLALGLCVTVLPGHRPAVDQERGEVTLPALEYRDRLRGSLAGQAFGLAWGFARGIEFRYRRRTVPDHDFSDPRTIDPRIAFRAPAGDDIYTESAGMRALLEHGPIATWSQLAREYARTEFPLWHSDSRMRRNLQRGLGAPSCGHFAHQMNGPLFGHSDDLDAQMQVDFCGAICPGDPGAATTLAWKVGHLMGHGDGAIGACVMAAMNAEAYVAPDVASIVEAGVRAAPPGTRYRRLLDDVVRWHEQWPDDWRATWRALDERWGEDDRCPVGNGGGRMNDAAFNIDAKLHGGFVLIGLLYGGGDFLRSLEVTIRCGQDTDTSAQNLGSILGAHLGESRLPEHVVEWLDAEPGTKLEGTDWDARRVIEIQAGLAERVLEHRGGTVDEDGALRIRRAEWEPVIAEQWPLEDDEPLELSVTIERTSGGVVACTADTDERRAADVEWHFGDLSRAKGCRATHRYARSGDYEVTCYVIDDEGRSTIESRTISEPASSASDDDGRDR